MEKDQIYILKNREHSLLPLVKSLQDANDKIINCTNCGNIDTVDPCSLCGNNKRDLQTICVVEDVSDLWTFERIGFFRGLYHILGGSLSAINGVASNDLFLNKLFNRIEKQNVKGIAVRIFILDAGTPRAETCISFCRPGEEKAEDEVKQYKGFNAFIDQHSIPFLEDAVGDFQKDSMGGQLTIKAPNSRMPKLTKDSPLEDHINYILYNEINPGLAAHGGHGRRPTADV